MEAHDCTVPRFTFSLWGSKCSKTRPGSKISAIGRSYFSFIVLLGAQQRQRGVTKKQKNNALLLKVEILCNPIELLKRRKKNPKKERKKLYEQVDLVTLLLLFFFIIFLLINELYCISLEKKCNQHRKPFSLQPPPPMNKSDNPMFSLMSPCIAMFERK